MKTISEQANDIYTNKDYALYEIVEKLSHEFGTQYFGTKTRLGITKETCEQVDKLIAHVKDNYWY